MRNLTEYHRPETLSDALSLLFRPDVVTVPLGGGTGLTAQPDRSIQAVVDLSRLGLSYIRQEGSNLVMGATTTLQQLAEAQLLHELANGLVAQAAHRTAASLIRQAGTLAGTLLTEPEGILATALLALDAVATVYDPSPRSVPLDQLLGMAGGRGRRLLVTQIAIPGAARGRAGAMESVARTPADRPIVAACVTLRADQGLGRDVRVTLCGVAPTAMRLTAAEAALEGQDVTAEATVHRLQQATAMLTPPGDFRGSSEYRREMAAILIRRAVRAAWDRACG